MSELMLRPAAVACGQAPTDVVLVRPIGFRPNTFTAADNAFQSQDLSRQPHEIALAAYAEVTNLDEVLRAHGVTVRVFDDIGDDCPDSVFPNNWFSTHSDGRMVLYPMFSPNRRAERRPDIVDALRREYRICDVLDFSGMEAEGTFLEGTGAMVLDHLQRVAYIARSNRADEDAARRVCGELGYEPVVFSTADVRGIPIYHTNVMMCMATDFAMVGLETIPDADERAAVQRRIRSSGRTIIDLTHEQIDDFAGNAIELQGGQRRLLVLSQRAYDSLQASQREQIERSAMLLPVAVPTIELSGGSVRCMISGIHVDPR